MDMMKLDRIQVQALIEYHRKEIRDIEEKIRALEGYMGGVSVEEVAEVRVSVRPVEEMFNPRRMVMDMLEREWRFLKTVDFVREAEEGWKQRNTVEFRRQMSNMLAGLKVAGKLVNYEGIDRLERYWGLPGWFDAEDKPLEKYKIIDF